MQRAPRQRAVTRADVAAHAGVSTALVSYVVTGARKVGPASEARVLKAIAELGYRPNRMARALKTGRSDVLGLVITDVTNPYFAEFALEIERAAAERGHAVMLVNSQSSTKNERRLIEDLVERGVDGLIIGSSAEPGVSSTGLEHVPAVWIDSPQPGRRRASVGAAMERGAEQLVTHLIERHGLTSLALALGGGGPREGVDRRQAGWAAALAAAGLEQGRIVEGAWSREGGYDCGRLLLEQGEPPQAIFATSDLMAVGILRAAADLGLRVPHDLAVVSYDGTKESEFSSPRLTTLRQPIPAMARAAVDAVLDPAHPVAHQQFDGELLIRESCGCTDSR